MLRILCVERSYLSPTFICGAFLLSKIWRWNADMCDLSNDEIFERWQKCNRDNLPQGADYWYDFMSKRAKRGYKGARAVIDKMDRLR